MACTENLHGNCTERKTAEATWRFYREEELKPGCSLRRGDVGHGCGIGRMKMPKADRYKTVSLKTTDISALVNAPLTGCRHPVSHQA